LKYRAEVRLEAGGRYRAMIPKDIKKRRESVIFSGEIGHNVGPGGEIWSAPLTRGEVWRKCF